MGSGPPRRCGAEGDGHVTEVGARDPVMAVVFETG